MRQETSDREASSVRYAVYYVPAAGSDLSRLGQAWLGRDCWSDRPLARPRLPGLDDFDVDAVTAAPRRYGLHATLKAPFRLAETGDEARLLAYCRRFAADLAAVECPPLKVAVLDGFAALTPSRACPALDRLAATTVEGFDPFRAPPTANELARRRGAGLSARQDALLEAWGYPYVMEEFRFHITLTGKLSEPLLARLCPVLESYFAPLVDRPHKIDAISVVRQGDDDENFMVIERCPLSPPAARQPAAGRA